MLDTRNNAPSPEHNQPAHALLGLAGQLPAGLKQQEQRQEEEEEEEEEEQEQEQEEEEEEQEQEQEQEQEKQEEQEEASWKRGRRLKSRDYLRAHGPA